MSILNMFSCQQASVEYLQHMISWINKKNYQYFLAEKNNNKKKKKKKKKYPTWSCSICMIMKSADCHVKL